MRDPLVLSEEQLATVMTAAHSVPSCWKDRFLAAVADRLIGQPLTNAAIIAATDNVRIAMLAGVPDDE